MSAALEIEIGFDFTCPWCLIGLRNLQTALVFLKAEKPEVAVRLQWRGAQLLPDVPQAGWPFHEFYRRRLGGEAAMRQRQATVLRAAEAAGARIDYSIIEIMPNTADAHRLLAYAQRHGSGAQRDQLLERLLRAYFEEGDDIGHPLVLLAHGVAAGFELAALQAELRGAGQPYLPDGPGAGSSGVPFYSINGALALIGAQSPAMLLDAMREALAAQAQIL